ncbi:hypothetical protein CCP3SC1_740012 [Gammaproteobacteria bacterium]
MLALFLQYHFVLFQQFCEIILF